MNNTEKLYQALMQGLAIPQTLIDESLAYQSIPEWDSMAHMYLMSEIENVFEISIATEHMLEMTDLKSIKEKLELYHIPF